MIEAEVIKKRIAAQLPNAQIEVNGDDGRHFAATVIAAEFIGKTRVQQQQMVYACVNDLIQDGSLHALSLKTLTPDTNN